MFVRAKLCGGLASVLLLAGCGGPEPGPIEAAASTLGDGDTEQVEETPTTTVEPMEGAAEGLQIAVLIDGMNPLALYDYAVAFNSVDGQIDPGVVVENCDSAEQRNSGLYTVENCAQMMLELNDVITPSPDSERWMGIVSERFNRAYSYAPFERFAHLALEACDNPTLRAPASSWISKSAYAEVNSIRTLGECIFITEEDRAASEALQRLSSDTIDLDFCRFLFRDRGGPVLDDSSSFDDVVAHIDEIISALDALDVSSAAAAREVEEMKQNEELVRAYMLETESTLGELQALDDELAIEVGSLHTHDVTKRVRFFYTPLCAEARMEGRLD